MSSINEVSALISLLGEENVDEIRKAITEELIENIRESIRYEWLLLPKDIEEGFKSIMEEESEKLLKTYRKEIREELKLKYSDWVAQINNRDVEESK